MDQTSYEYLLNDSVLLNIKLVLEQSKHTLEQAHNDYDEYDYNDVHKMIHLLGETLSTTQSELINLINQMMRLKKTIRIILDIG